ncbi:MAG: hypothetical protein KIT79_03925 [Deltaproteobacteria bacterium]|nr:hypothetical protein [Deltaproteobacteria bacterium]
MKINTTFGKMLILFAFAIGMMAMPSVASAATFTVDSKLDTFDDDPGDGICDDGDGNCTLRAAIEEANASSGRDAIIIGVTGTIVLSNGSFNCIVEGLKIIGPGSGVLTIDVDETDDGPLFGFDSAGDPSDPCDGDDSGNGGAHDFVLKGLTIENLDAWPAVYVANTDYLNLIDLTVTNSNVEEGATDDYALAAFVAIDGSADLTDIVITDSTGTTVTDGSNCRAEGSGIAVAGEAGTVNMMNITVTGLELDTIGVNCAQDTGMAAISVTGGNKKVTITNALIDSNTVTWQHNNSWREVGGPGIVINGADKDVTLDNVTVTNNTFLDANTGGNSSAEDRHGGAGLYIGSGSPTVWVLDSYIGSNESEINGGGVLISGGYTTFVNTTIEGNSAVGHYEDQSDPDIGGGGGIFITGAPKRVDIIQSTIRDNTTENDGGGIHMRGASSTEQYLNILNSSIANNSAEGNGGGIHRYAGTATLIHTTVDGNSAEGIGGGLSDYYTNSDTPPDGWPRESRGISYLANSILSGSSDSDTSSDCVGNVKSFGGSVVETAAERTCKDSLQASDRKNVAAQVTGLQQGGTGPQGNAGEMGIGQVLAIAGNSPAVNLGLAQYCNFFDQRGVLRSHNACDAGAFQAGGGGGGGCASSSAPVLWLLLAAIGGAWVVRRRRAIA